MIWRHMIGLQWRGLLLICKPRLRPKSLAAHFPFSPPSITHRQHLANICPQLGPRNQQHGVGSTVRHHHLLQPLRQHANVPCHRLLTAHRLKRPSWMTRCPKIRLRTKRTKKRTGKYYFAIIITYWFKWITQENFNKAGHWGCSGWLACSPW